MSEGTIEAVPPSQAYRIVTVLALALGSTVVLVGWIVGVALLWGCKEWRLGYKILGTLVLPAGILFPVLLAVFLPSDVSSTACANGHCQTFSSGPPWEVGVALLVVLLAAQVVSSVLVYRGYGRRR